MIPASANPLLLRSAATQYQVSRSLRFNSADSAYLSRTPASAGNRKTWTWAGWMKRSGLTAGDYVHVFGQDSIANYTVFLFKTGADSLQFWINPGLALETANLLRDPSAWYHIVLAVDTTQATASNRVKIYINGTEATYAVDSRSSITQNADTLVNSTNVHSIASSTFGRYFNGYLADIHFIDGQALTPSSFTEVSATTGQLVPKAYTGTYGTNGFKLDFADNSNNTATTLGKDTSGNNNNWTPNNLQAVTGGPTSVAAASGGLPVYNTTDTYGATKGTGTRTDSNSSSIVLALPMDGANNGTTFTDESATIKGSGSAKTVTANGNAKTVTSQSKYYGSSGAFDGSGDFLSISGTHNIVLGSSDFTIEGWIYPNSSTGGSIFTNTDTWQAGRYNLTCGQSAGSTVLQWIVNSINGGSPVVSSNTNLTVSAWSHFAVTRSGSTSRMFINGVETSTYTSATSVGDNGSLTIRVGATDGGSVQYFNGNLQDIRVYVGVAKYTSNFTVVSSTQNTTTARACDSLVDTPTSYGTDTSVGGEVRGNYCTLNPLDNGGGTLSNGNLDWSHTASTALRVTGTIGIPSSGKWYWEYVPGGSAAQGLGLAVSRAASGARYLYQENAQLEADVGGGAYGATYGAGDVIGVAYNADSNQVTFYKNNVSQGTKATTSGVTYFPCIAGYNSTVVCNFGQRQWAYQAPAGFKALCDTNLPAPVIAKGSSAFDVKLYTGNGGTQTISGYQFSPDFVWVKSRSAAYSNHTANILSGTGKSLYTDLTNAEGSGTNIVTAFNSDGFSVGDNASLNAGGTTYVAWCWDAGSSTVTNTQGSINSQVRANASSGFSVVSWSGVAGANGTIGHGLGVAPQFVILKNRGTTDNWRVYHVSVGATGFLQLASTGATVTSDEFQNTSPTSTVFYLRGNTWNAASNNYIAYFFAPVAGYSSFGSYTGNGSADGPFVYTGFRPRWVMVKLSSAAGENWVIIDAARSDFNLADEILWANLSNAELGNYGSGFDFTANGFKIRGTWGGNNTSAATYVWAAFAENPFQYARAR